VSVWLGRHPLLPPLVLGWPDSRNSSAIDIAGS
jgi:hypothetical protein